MRKKVAVTLGRFQPPTVGHYAVIDKMKKFILDNEELKLDAIPVVIVIEGKKTSEDKSVNPLTAAERIAYMKASGKADGVKFFKARSAFDAFKLVQQNEMEPIAVAAGSDRAENYLEMLDKYFKDENGKSVDHFKIDLKRSTPVDAVNYDKNAQLEDILKYMDEDIPIEMVSASLARLAVTENEFKKFQIITGLTNKPKLAQSLFDKLARSMKDEK